MNIKSIILLKTAIRHLVQALGTLNRIPEDDYRRIVLIARKRTKYIRGAMNSLEQGNLFMAIFFLREILESIANE